MSKSMLINVVQEEESRVAIVDAGVLDFFEIETLSSETLKGNIYKGVVENVNPSLEAAFVNCGWDRPGFLPLDEVNFKVLPTVKTRKGGSKILEHVAPGMEFLVQVIRDRFNSKPPSLTTYYSLPGRYLVLAPFSDGSGISRRIEDEEQRAKLRKMVEDLRPPEGFGVIVRTAGLDQERSELVRDMGYLLRLWETVERASSVARAPSLIYKERDLALRTIRDHLTDDIEEVLIDDAEVHENAIRFIRAVAPHQESRIKLYTGDKPVFTRFNLEEQIETIYKRRVPLKSGGEIVIEETEAMTAIDVNSSRSREGSAEEMSLRTNVEAAAEVARQLRLRDLGGLIVIDFIDMEAPKHVRAVEKALRDAMRPDKAKYDATRISKLGILEISRQRMKAAKAQATYVTCPSCDGLGTVRTTEAAALAALRRIQTRVVRGDIGSLKATLPTEVALYLLNQKRDELLSLETRYGVKIALTPTPDYAQERCEIETAAREGSPPWSLPQTARPRPAAREERASEIGRKVGKAARAEERSEEPAAGVARTGSGHEAGHGSAAAAGPEGGFEVRSDAHEDSHEEGGAELRKTATADAGHRDRTEAAPLLPSETLEGESFEIEPVWADPLAGTAREARTLARNGDNDERDSEREGEAAGPAMSPEGSQPGPAPADSVSAVAGKPGAPLPRTRRRKRGGRGRNRAAAAEASVSPASGAERPVPHLVEDEEDEAQERLVWEDAEDEEAELAGVGAPPESSRQPATSFEAQPRQSEERAEPPALGENAGLPGAAANAEGEGVPGAPVKKKRRRRRGGRGRKKKLQEEGAAVTGGTVGGAEPDRADWDPRGVGGVTAGPLEAEESSVDDRPAEARSSGTGVQKSVGGPTARSAAPGRAEAGSSPKRRRRRRGGARGDAPGARADKVVPDIAASSATPHSSVQPTRARPVAEPEPAGGTQDDDVPGGWWSRLRGSKKRGGRED